MGKIWTEDFIIGSGAFGAQQKINGGFDLLNPLLGKVDGDLFLQIKMEWELSGWTGSRWHHENVDYCCFFLIDLSCMFMYK